MVPNSNYSNATEQMRSEYRRSLAIEEFARNAVYHMQAWRSEYSWARYKVDYEHDSYSSDRHVVRDRNRIVQQKLIGTTTFPMGVVVARFATKAAAQAHCRSLNGAVALRSLVRLPWWTVQSVWACGGSILRKIATRWKRPTK